MRKKGLWIWIVILVAVGGFVGWRVWKGKHVPIRYRTEMVQRGDVKEQVTATGNLTAVTTVQVGSQVSGTISALNVDFNDKVHKGQILAQLDPTFLKAQVDQSRADLVSAQVQMQKAERDSARVFPLAPSQMVSQADLDAAKTTLDAARASVTSAKAGLNRAETNLRYATIQSPIDGVVVSRDVDVGQTVAASLSAPTLYTIANDLTRMQLEVAVDEADIGMVKDGQNATFTVDAYPDLTFHGTVHQIRLNPATVQNVVTYTVIIFVDNPDLKLLPGMTANVSILADQQIDVLKIPVMALRFRPPAAASPRGNGGGARLAAAGTAGAAGAGAAAGGQGGQRRHGGGEGGSGAMMASAQGAGGQSRGGGGGRGASGHGQGGDASGAGGADSPTETDNATTTATIYLLDGPSRLRPLTVRTGLSDGSFIAVFSDSLRQGMPVVIAADTQNGGQGSGQGQVNPFAPRMGGGGRR